MRKKSAQNNPGFPLKRFALLSVLICLMLTLACEEPGETITVEFTEDGKIAVTVYSRFSYGDSVPERDKRDYRKAAQLYENGGDPWLERFEETAAEGIESSAERRDNGEIKSITRKASVAGTDELNDLLTGLPVIFKRWDDGERRILEMYPMGSEASTLECRRQRKNIIDEGAAAMHTFLAALETVYVYLDKNAGRREALLTETGLFGFSKDDETGLVPTEEEAMIVEEMEKAWNKLERAENGAAGRCFRVMDKKLRVKLPVEPVEYRGWKKMDEAGLTYGAGPPTLLNPLVGYLRRHFDPEPDDEDLTEEQILAADYRTEPLPFESDIRKDLKEKFDLPALYRLVW